METRGAQKEDCTEKAAIKMIDLAERGELAALLKLAAMVTRRKNRLSGPQKMRWPSYKVYCPTRIRSLTQVSAWLYGYALVALYNRTLEGGRHATIHLQYGRRPPPDAVSRNVSHLLRQSGLKARIVKRYEDSTAVMIRL